MKGIYVHIPYCAAKCAYCTFISGMKGNEEAYFKALADEIMQSRAPVEKPDTVYIGGGTPSCVDIKYIEKTVEALNKRFDMSNIQEFTIEVNPESVNRSKTDSYKGLGINRISMGVQSENDDVLNMLGRIHKHSDSIRALDDISGQFENVSIDYIWGIAGNMIEMTIPESYPITHISSYCLSIDKGSRLEQNGFKQDDEEKLIKEYEGMLDSIRGMGFSRYEVSNYAVNGKESVHNSLYWDRRNIYAGFGIGASSYYDEKRIINSVTMEDYLSSNRGCIEEILDNGTQHMESIMLGLRTAAGIEQALAGQSAHITEELSELGLIIVEMGRLRLTDKGFLLLDSIVEKYVNSEIE